MSGQPPQGQAINPQALLARLASANQNGGGGGGLPSSGVPSQGAAAGGPPPPPSSSEPSSSSQRPPQGHPPSQQQQQQQMQMQQALAANGAGGSRPPSQAGLPPTASAPGLPAGGAAPGGGQASFTPQQQQAAQQQRALVSVAMQCTQGSVRFMQTIGTPLPAWFTTPTLPDGSPNPSYLTIGLGAGVSDDGSSGGKRLEAWKLWIPVLQTGSADVAFSQAIFSRFCAYIHLAPTLSAPTPVPRLASATPEQLAQPPKTDLAELLRETFEVLFGETHRRRAASVKQAAAASKPASAGGPAPATTPAAAAGPAGPTPNGPQQQGSPSTAPAVPLPPPTPTVKTEAAPTPPPAQSTTPSGPPPPSLLATLGQPPMPSPTPQPQLQAQQPQLSVQGATPSPVPSSAGPSSLGLKLSSTPQPQPSDPSARPSTAGGATPPPPSSASPAALAASASRPTALAHQRPSALGGPSASGSGAPTPPIPRGPNWAPLTRAVGTQGGWDLDKVQTEQAALTAARAPARVGEFTTLDLDALAMALRSRLQAEVAYALQVVEMLAGEVNTRPGGEADGILPVEHCMELWEELVVLLEETAFGDDGVDGEKAAAAATTSTTPADAAPARRFYQTDLLSRAHDELAHSTILRSLGPSAAADSAAQTTRRSQIVLKVVGILRDLSLQRENIRTAAADFAMLETLLLLCRPSSAGLVVHPESGVLVTADDTDGEPLLSVFDLLSVRQDVLHVLATVAIDIPLLARSCPPTLLLALVDFLGSFINDPAIDLYPPGSTDHSRGSDKAMLAAAVFDMAVDAFTQLTVQDPQRALLARAVADDDLVRLYEALARTLPVADADLVWLQIPRWQTLAERVALGLFSLAFAAPPALKHRLRQSRSSQQVVPHVFKLVVRQGIGRPFAANKHAVLARRLAEVLGQLDDRDDDEAVGLSFGSGLGESKAGTKRKRKQVRGGSWLAGEDRLWSVLSNVVDCDPVAWEELEQLYFCT